ncbi:hypothetical protein FHU38_005421 [Saccharomonospora amisosensis]|uniref:Polyketide cyclase / dehydrase and lipid transport n=1 Tax=Saccharomonospora amisosensis TaxID=1128677 RepID=A0A7X5UWJ0_9PSEU|nr:SRPBCC family protein [Saccharomonospora amisosensis]NIJ15013.1 hypothetical protein [Saccharomonospora amisosensis]
MPVESTSPDATGQIEIQAPAEKVYELLNDPGVLAELSGEYSGYKWLGQVRSAWPGARFRGYNRNGPRRWSTVATITDAEDGKRFAFDVSAGPLAISRWQYDIEQTDNGCLVTESTWDRRAGWLRTLTGPISGVRDRASANERNIAATLRGLKERVES